MNSELATAKLEIERLTKLTEMQAVIIEGNTKRIEKLNAQIERQRAVLDRKASRISAPQPHTSP